MTNILLLILTSASGYLFGRAIEKNNARQERFMFDLTNFCRQMQNNIAFSKLSLANFFERFKQEADDSFNKMLAVFLESGTIKPPFAFSKRQKVYLERFLIGLNGVNTAECANHLIYFSDYFGKELVRIQTENNSRTRLYQKLGLLAGVIVGIILI